MSREYRLYLHEILQAVQDIGAFVSGQSFEDFRRDKKTFHAVIRNVLVIGEAVKGIPEEIRALHAEIEWKKIAGARDYLVHHYFEINVHIVWDIINNELPSLEKAVQEILTRRE